MKCRRPNPIDGESMDKADPTPPCRDCGHRATGCHAGCKRYIAWKAARDTVRAAARKKQSTEDNLDNYAAETSRRLKNKYGR